MNQGGLKLDYIRISGFRGFPAEKEIRFGKPAVFLFGPNGSGKSSILNSIEWSLFGKEVTKKGSGATRIEERVGWEEQNLEAKKIEVELGFSNPGGQKFIIRREQGKKKYYLYLQGKSDPVEDEEVQAELGINWPTYLASTHIHQETIRNLLIVEPKDRKTLIYFLLGLSEIQALNDSLGKELKEANKLPQNLEAELNAFEEQLKARLFVWEEDKARQYKAGQDLGLKVKNYNETGVVRICREIKSCLEGMVKDFGLGLIELGDFEGGSARREFLKKMEEAITRIQNENPSERESRQILDLKFKLTAVLKEYGNHKENLKSLDKSWGDLARKVGKKQELERELPQLKQKLETAKKQREVQHRLAGLVDEAIKFFRTSIVKVDNCPVCGQKIDPGRVLEALESHKEGMGKGIQELSQKIEEDEKLVIQTEKNLKEFSRIEGERNEEEEKLSKMLPGIAELLTLLEIGEREDPEALIKKRLEELEKRNAELLEARKAVNERVAFVTNLKMQCKAIDGFLEFEGRLKKMSELQEDPAFKERAEAWQEAYILPRRLEILREAVEEVLAEEARAKLNSAREEIARIFKHITGRSYYSELFLDEDGELIAGEEEKKQKVISIFNQGDMNAAALSIFLGLSSHIGAGHRLGFVVLDDPSQNMDSEYKQRLAGVLNQVAEKKQIIISTMDGEFQELLKEKVTKHRLIHQLSSWDSKKGPEIQTTES